jgi:hypothetical protein
MAHMSIPTTVVETQKGECNIHITLDLNINLAGGVVGIESVKATPKKIEKEEEDVKWAIPEFDSGIKVNFGKKE